MRQILIIALLASYIRADCYTDYIDAGFTNAQTEFGYYNELVVDTSAAMIAMSNIDFFKHEGFSAGAGLATIHTPYGIGNAYAMGIQYGISNVMFNIKGSYKGDGEYIFGSGLVVGF